VGKCRSHEEKEYGSVGNKLGLTTRRWSEQYRAND
jgi:hypothetical protein